jgi:hypothetical protein
MAVSYATKDQELRMVRRSNSRELYTIGQAEMDSNHIVLTGVIQEADCKVITRIISW